MERLDMMKSQSGAAIYIVDREYRLIYYNQALKNKFPSLNCGDFCYRSLCGELSPCEKCPLEKEKNKSAIFYNKKVRQWVNVNVGEIEWPGHGSCYLVLAREIQENNKNLFYNLTSISSYDELFELNITADTYKILYHQEDKFVLPAQEGALGAMLRGAETTMIHPEDSAPFREFWALESLMQRLFETNPGDGLRGEFRRKKQNGEWCWTQQTVVPLRYTGKDDRIIMCFIQDIDAEKRRQLREAGDASQSRDPMTGLYNEQAFFMKMKEFLSGNRQERYCLVAIDIEHFKLFNEWYGREAGDKFLLDIAGYLKQAGELCGGIAGYFGDDDFCILLPEREEHLKHLEKKILGRVSRYGNNAGFLPAFGIYSIQDRSIPPATMYDRASIAMGHVKGKYASRSCRYHSNMIRKMEEEHVFLSEIQRALEKREFTFYLQPQCSLSTGKVVGMESLVRWNHPERGVVMPGEFIPMLEKNGFITELDLYIWDSVCSWLRECLDQGRTAVPISVNVSRVDLYTMDVPKRFQELTERYSLPPSLIKIEITESAYAEGYQFITEVVEQLRSQGFQVMMDDFGNGYSSLNMLKDVNVDVLKIDMKFLQADAQSDERGAGILEAVVSMARLMGIRTIAEGVETLKQLEFLKEIGCRYGQGYYFYRPMPVKHAQKLLENGEKLDLNGMRVKALRGLRIREILREDLFSETMLNHILGGIVVYEVSRDRIEISQANDQYCHIVGENPDELDEHKKTFLEYIYKDDDRILRDLFESAFQNRISGEEADVRYLKEDGTTIWLHIRAFYLGEQDGRRLYYGSVSDATERYKQEKMLESSQRLLSQNQELQFLNRDIPGGCYHCADTEEFDFLYVSERFLEIFGYTREELKQEFGNKLINMIHPEDREMTRKWALENRKNEKAGNTPLEYRMKGRDGYIWVLDQSRYTEYSGGLFLQGIMVDITETVELRNKMRFLMKYTPETILMVTLKEEVPSYSVITDGLCRGLGFTIADGRGRLRAEEIKRHIHREDWERLKSRLHAVSGRQGSFKDTFQLKRQDGQWNWALIDVRFIREDQEGSLFLCILRDVTREHQQEEKAAMMSRRLETILKMAGIVSWDWDISQNTLTLSNPSQMPELPLKQSKSGKNMVLRNFSSIIERSGLIPDDYRKQFLEYFSQVKNGGPESRIRCELPVKGREGNWLWLRICCETFCDKEGTAVRAVGYYADITEEKKYSMESRENMKVLNLLRGQALYDFKANLTRDEMRADQDSHRWRRESGCTEESYTGVIRYLLDKLVLPEFREELESFTDRDCLLAGFSRNGQMKSMDYMRMYCGKPRWLRLIIHLARLDDTEDVFAYMFIMDIHAQKRQEQRLTKMAQTDALTGLYNRHAAVPEIEKYLKYHKNETAALIMFDLDNFKLANDIFGHAYGDSLLSQTAARLKGFFRGEDIVCRLGGDEFLVLCRNIREDSVERKLRTVLEALMMTFRSGERKSFFSVSAGYAMAPEHGDTFQELYQNADIALFTAKMRGKNSYVKYDPSMKKVRYELAESGIPEDDGKYIR